MKPGTQTERLYRFLLAHPGASSMEIQHEMSITNATGRISDLRSEGDRLGFAVVRKKRPDGLDGYVIQDLSDLNLGLTA